jgi:8-oxo-dGTP diphosphatase
LALPGGHLELYESWTACAQREVMEEMGLNIVVVSCSSENDENESSSSSGSGSSSSSLAHVTNDVMTAERKHYVTLFVMAKCQDLSAVPQNCEPHKCEGWHSYSWSELQELWALQQQQQQGDEDDDPGNNTITTTATTTTTTTTTTTLPRLFGPLAQLVADNPETVRRFLSSSHA